MNTSSTFDQTKPRHQTNWDWRAASNFMFGGSGSGLLLLAALSVEPGTAYRPFGLVALGLIALGLFCVSLEIGRPLRSLNVFLHLRTSWMTREALAAPLLFVCGLLAVWTGGAVWIWLAALSGMLFLYCQARILTASKGIPAWRSPRLAPLIIITGLTEGTGLLLLVSTLSGVAPQTAWVPATLLIALALRAMLWHAYRGALARDGAPPQTLRALDAIDLPFVKIGHWAAGLMLALVLVAPGQGAALWLAGIAGLLAVASGWIFKYTLVARAAYNQGYALPRIPVRGRAPASTPGKR